MKSLKKLPNVVSNVICTNKNISRIRVTGRYFLQKNVKLIFIANNLPSILSRQKIYTFKFHYPANYLSLFFQKQGRIIRTLSYQSCIYALKSSPLLKIIFYIPIHSSERSIAILHPKIKQIEHYCVYNILIIPIFAKCIPT